MLIIFSKAVYSSSAFFEACLHTAGYDDVKTIVVLGSDAALHKAQDTRPLIGADLDVIVGNDTPVVQSDVSETQAIPYSMADGALIDFSVKGIRFLLHVAYAELYNVPTTPQAKSASAASGVSVLYQA